MTDRRPTASVVVPTYQEAAIVEASLDRIAAHLATIADRFECEVVVVDDGSTDGTAERAEAYAATASVPVTVLRHRVNFHLGQALRTAFNHCRTDYVVVVDCDLSYAPEHIGRLLDAIHSTGARVVIASPYMRGGTTTGVPFVRRVASRVANRVLGLAASGDLRTLTGMVRAYDCRFVAALDLKAMGTEINTEILYKAQVLRARIEEIPAHLAWTRPEAGGRRPPMGLVRGTVRSLVSAFFFRPFAFFLVPALALAIGALVAAVAGSGAVAVGAVAAAFVLFVAGLLALQAKRNFEETFHLGTTILRELRRTRHDPI